MMISTQTRLLQACRSVIEAEKEQRPELDLQDQLAARLLLLSDRIRALALIVEEIELAR